MLPAYMLDVRRMVTVEGEHADPTSRGSHFPPEALGAHQEPLRVPARYKLERPAQNWFDEAHDTGRDLSWPG